MMFGSRQPFEYRVCDDCGSASLSTPPANMGDYYPDGYYSFTPNVAVDSRGERLKKRLATETALRGRLVPGRVKNRLGPAPEWKDWFEGTGVTTRSRVLDVGSGGGRRLVDMAGEGFKHLEGVDPFIDADIDLPNGVRIHKGWIDDVAGSFDVIMFNHSLEHFDDPIDALRAAAQRL